MLKICLILTCLTAVLTAYYEQIIMITVKGRLDYRIENNQKSVQHNEDLLNWQNAAARKNFPLGVSFRSGENSAAMLLIAEQVLFYLDEKTTVQISAVKNNAGYDFTCCLISGRTALEKKNVKKGDQFYSKAGQIKFKLKDGKHCLRYKPRLNTIRIIQYAGETLTLPPSPDKPGQTPRFSFFTLSSGQRADFKGFRYNMYPDHYLKKNNWRFAFPVRKNRQDGMLDLKEKWH